MRMQITINQPEVLHSKAHTVQAGEIVVHNGQPLMRLDQNGFGNELDTGSPLVDIPFVLLGAGEIRMLPPNEAVRHVSAADLVVNLK
jgi:hypothetical protein